MHSRINCSSREKNVPTELALLAEVVNTDQERALTTGTIGELKVGGRRDMCVLDHLPALRRWSHVGRSHLFPFSKNEEISC